MPEKEVVDRAEEDLREGKSPVHGGGRIRPRGDRTRAGGETRRTLATAGDRHRTEQGSPRRDSACSPQGGKK